MFDTLFTAHHEGQRPGGVSLPLGTPAGGLAAASVGQGQRAGQGLGRNLQAVEIYVGGGGRLPPLWARFSSTRNYTCRTRQKSSLISNAKIERSRETSWEWLNLRLPVFLLLPIHPKFRKGCAKGAKGLGLLKV